MTAEQIATIQQRRVGCTDAATLQGVLSELLTMIERHRAALVVSWWKHTDARRQKFGFHVSSARNGEILGGGEGYVARKTMMRAIDLLYPGVEKREICAPGSITTKGGAKV
jgi:hypothetical protein